jgi:hypothetical protein
MSDIQKYILEGLIKYILIDKLNKTSKKNNKDLENYIIYEMSFEKLLLLNTNYKLYLTEDMNALAAQKEVALGKNVKGAAAALDPILQLGFAIAVGGKIMSMATSASKGTGAYAGFVGPVGIVGGILASIGMSFGLSLLSKVVQYAIMKIFSPCEKMCNRKFSATTGVMAPGELNAENKLCKTQCRVDAYNKVIAELKRQLSNCPKTQNPDRCMSGINTQLAKYQKLIADEQDSLKKNQQKLADVKRKASIT